MPIDRVGVTDLILPIQIKFNSENVKSTSANISAYVSLTAKERGTHMSRMARIINDFVEEVVTYESLCDLFGNLQKKLSSKKIFIEIKFLLFKRKEAPITKNQSYVNYNCRILAEKSGEKLPNITLEASVPITSLCPVSKSISDYGAHNQRGEVTISVELKKEGIWFEDLIHIAEKNGSSEIFGVLKREDEKYVTEKAYDNARIVEDIVRAVAAHLRNNGSLSKWRVSCKNFESIHTHNAFAEIKGENKNG